MTAWAVGAGQETIAQNGLLFVQKGTGIFPPEASGKEDVSGDFEDRVSLSSYFLISPPKSLEVIY